MQWQMAKLSSRPTTEKVMHLHRQAPVRVCSASDIERCCCGERWETESNGSVEGVESKFQIPEEWGGTQSRFERCLCAVGSLIGYNRSKRKKGNVKDKCDVYETRPHCR